MSEPIPVTARPSKARAVRDPHAHGRRIEITPELTERICNLLRAGCPLETAAIAVGVTKNTLYVWMRKGIEGDSRCVAFAEATEQAMAEAEVRNIAIVQAAAKEAWQASAWWLERRFPSRWGREERLAVAPSAPALDLSKLSNEELKQLESLQRKAGAGG